MAGASLKVPHFCHEELGAFHDAHFSQAAIEKFGSQFCVPTNDADAPAISQYEDEHYYEHWEEEEEDDDLGYYPDGVKRTLTDEQIAMFRHSELEALRRAEEKALGKSDKQARCQGSEGGEQLSEGEVSETPAPSTKKKSKNKRRRTNKPRPQPEGQQIDLRKRTWDVVGAGLDSLDYGESEEGPYPAANAAQRRRISYDD